jgi:hypothetical protein
MPDHLKPLKELDAVLYFLADRELPASKEEIKKGLEVKNIHIEEIRLRRILQKLLKEDYIVDGNTDYYSITWNGEYFMVCQNGYETKEKNRLLRLKSKKNHEKKARKNEVLIVIGTLGATIGTVALFYMEVIKFLRDANHKNALLDLLEQLLE